MSDKGSIKQTARLSDEELELLAYVLEDEGVEPVEARGIPRRPAELSEIPLSFGQRRLWFLDRLKPGDPVYNISTAVRLEGRLDVPALEQTFTEIVRRHEALRTTFELIEVTPVQVVSAPEPRAIPLIDLGHLPAGEREAEAERLAREETLRPFDLTRGPLMRGLLLRLEESVHLVVVTMHHIVSDGWSRGVLIQEVAALYEAFSGGKPSPLAELPIQYADYAVWQREWLRGEVLDSQLSYWREQLRDLPTLELPTDRPRPPEQSFRGARHNFVLPRRIVEGIRAVAQAHEATTFMVLLAAYSVLLTRYSGQTEVSVGAPIANRRRAELEGLIGFFVNTLVLRVKVEAGEGFGSLVERVREVCLGAYAHQDVPFEKLVEELQPERSLSHAPLFQVALVLQNVPRSSLDLQGLSLSQYQLKYETAKFELSLVLGEGEGGITGALMYLTDLFDASTAARMVKNFQTLLRDITENPDKKIEDLSMFDDEGSRELIRAFNDELE
jgi:hypothetical protein